MNDKLKFDEAIKHMQDKLQSTASTVGVFTESEAKLRSPVDTGHLRRSISHDTMVDNTRASVFTGTSVDYAPYVERDQPYIKPAIMENTSSIQSLIHKGLKV